jgi:hypothetical protein
MDMCRIQNGNVAQNVGVLVSLKRKREVVTMNVKETNKWTDKCISAVFRVRLKSKY